MRTYNRLTFALAATLSLGAAFGDDFLTGGASARNTATAGAYSPRTDSALDAMALNPAGLALLNSGRLDLSVGAMFARGTFTNRANTDGRLNANGAIPYGAFGTPLGKSRFSLGFAALPELASAARWRYVDTPGGAGNVSYGPMNHNSEILAVRFAAGVGINLGSKVQVGATLGAVYNENTLQTAYVFQNHPALAGLKTGLDLKTNGTGLRGTVGVLVKPSRKWDLGVTYKSQANITSKGVATGNIGVQLAAAGLGSARPDFRYDAQVDNVLPQSILVNLGWQATARTRLLAQTDWVNWRRAFSGLPVTLTNGNNADINGLLGTNGINDLIPLDWKNQLVARVGVERSWLENTVVRAGYAHSSNPVPNSTLSPLTAAITQHTISGGLGYTHGRYRFDLGYSVDPSVHSTVGQSALKAGEYSNSRTSVNTQMLVFSTSIRLY